MPDLSPNGGDRRQRRRWTFATYLFDEGNWALMVDGKRVPIETKPLELLRELLVHAGNVVTKDELLDRIWPDVTVVEASLPTAVRKLRLALGDDRRDHAVIETVQGIGYRLSVPVEIDQPPAVSLSPLTTAQAAPPPDRPTRFTRLAFISAGAAIGIVAIVFSFAPSQPVSATRSVPPYTQRDAANALRKLDMPAIERMIAAGWDPNTPFDKEGNGAVNYLLNMCEWDRGHDKHKMLLMARTLFEAGASVTKRNVWGDTSYSIAKAARYCGPDHPVTKMMHMMCTEGDHPLGDRCLASYELTRQRKQRNG